MTKSRFIKTLVVLLIIAGGAFAYVKFGPSKQDADSTLNTATVTRGDVEAVVTAQGKLEPKNYVDVGAEVSGQIEKLHVDYGSVVKSGDLLAEIDPTVAEAKVTADQAALASLQAQVIDRTAQLDLAQKQLTRQQNLMKDEATSQDALQTAEATLRSNKAQLAALQAQVKQSESTLDADKANLGFTKIYAPMGGTVVSLSAQQGQTINASQTAPIILQIADLDTMIIKAQISEADVTRVAPGQHAYFTILGEPDNQIDATLLSVEPAPDAIADADTGISSSDDAIYYNGLFQVDNPDHRLRIAMTAKVTIVLKEAKDALTISSSLLGDKGPNGKYEVRVYDPASKTVRPTPITVGLDNNIVAEVTSGLKEGDLVVTGGVRRVVGNTPEGGNARGPGGRRGPVFMGL